MNNLVASAKKFFKNKNVVTIIGVVVILILLYVGYSTQINNAVEPVQVPVATQTIQPRTEITDDMVQMVDMPNVSLSDNVIRSRSQIVGQYSNVNSVIPEGSMFYTDTVISEDELPDAAFAKVKSGEVVYNFPVDMESTYGNSIFPGNMIDIYMKVGNGTDERIMLGKLIENVEVLAVKDSSGRAVFENTSEDRTPAMLIFGLKSDLYTILKKASYMESLGVELYPVPHGGEVAEEGATQVSTQQLVDYIDAHSVNIPVPDETDDNDELMPTVSETGGNPNTVTITFPEGCDGTYTCTYVKDGGRSQTVTGTTQELVYTGNGTLTATVQEKDGTPHSITIDIPMNNSTE
ncbi:uncharacterized protein BN793_00280 [Firmicutes bacterium CAG:822]|nr:uncharacterized protein BN793_00280 [Firmicutes bacterium CAG:822]